METIDYLMPYIGTIIIIAAIVGGLHFTRLLSKQSVTFYREMGEVYTDANIVKGHDTILILMARASHIYAEYGFGGDHTEFYKEIMTILKTRDEIFNNPELS